MPHTVYQYILSSTVYERWNGFLWHGLSFVVKIEFLWTKHKYMCVKLYSCWDKLIVLDQHSCFMNDKINYLGSTWHMPWTQKYRNQISTLYMNDVWEKNATFFLCHTQIFARCDRPSDRSKLALNMNKVLNVLSFLRLMLITDNSWNKKWANRNK